MKGSRMLGAAALGLVGAIAVGAVPAPRGRIG
jgi:hypothetical protein